jgi:hypothetical protein
MEGSGKMLVIGVGEHSQTGLISKLLRSPGRTGRIIICLLFILFGEYYFRE